MLHYGGLLTERVCAGFVETHVIFGSILSLQRWYIGRLHGVLRYKWWHMCHQLRDRHVVKRPLHRDDVGRDRSQHLFLVIRVHAIVR